VSARFRTKPHGTSPIRNHFGMSRSFLIIFITKPVYTVEEFFLSPTPNVRNAINTQLDGDKKKVVVEKRNTRF
jgi:hypothetical protein